MKKSKTQIAVIKYQTLKLRGTYQLPLYLTKLIMDLNGHESVTYVQFLMTATEHYLRTKNYYKKYKEAEKICEDQIKQGLLEIK